MGFIYQACPSESAYIKQITYGRSEGEGQLIRPAEYHWHLVIVRYQGHVQLLTVGPLSSAGVVSWVDGTELIWIQLTLGTHMPYLPVRTLLDKEIALPNASSQSFWLQGSAWSFPSPDNADIFVERLARSELLTRDPVVTAVVDGQPSDLSARTVRHRFLHATGLTQTTVFQMERAQRAAARLRAGESILDTVCAEGYFDQPHLTRSLRRWIGHTPAQLTRSPLS